MPALLNPNKYKGKRVLIVQAHPDDADFFCGATALKLSKAGAEVIYLICTRGEKGTNDLTLDPAELTKIRREEQRIANDILGVSESIHFDYSDGELAPTSNLQGKITELIRRLKPELLMTFDLSRPEHRMHPDHRACALAALRANVFSALPNYFHEQIDSGLEPYRCEEILLFNPPNGADIYQPVFGSLFRKKFDAILAHKSQLAHMLNDEQKKLSETLLKYRLDPVIQLVAGSIESSFFIETFRQQKVNDLLH